MSYSEDAHNLAYWRRQEQKVIRDARRAARRAWWQKWKRPIGEGAVIVAIIAWGLFFVLFVG